MSWNLTEFFTQLGRCVAWTNTLLSDQNSIYLAPSTGLADNLLSQYESSRYLAPTFQATVQSMASAMAGQVSQVLVIAGNTISDPALQSSLVAPNAQTSTALRYLAAYMVVNSQSIEHTVLGSPTVAYQSGNVGNGILKIGTLNQYGIADERIVNEALQLICIADQWSGTVAGAEQFSLTGQPVIQPNIYGPIGHGSGPTVTVLDANNLINNGDFEQWVGNSPKGWTISAGTAGTNIIKSTTKHSGSYAMEYAGDGTTTTVTLTQTVAVTPQTQYVTGIWLRKGGTVTSGSTLTVTVVGQATQTLFSADPATLTTTYQLLPVFFSTQVEDISVTVNISWTSANSAGASALIYIDDFNLVLPTVFGYASYALFRGSTDFARGDTINAATVVSSAGVFQSFFGRFYNVALPSSASPTISDSLAT